MNNLMRQGELASLRVAAQKKLRSMSEVEQRAFVAATPPVTEEQVAKAIEKAANAVESAERYARDGYCTTDMALAAARAVMALFQKKETK